MGWMQQLAVAYLASVIGLSCVTFLVYGLDKRRSRREGRRIPEKTLQMLAILGGWPGAWAGQQVFRHKTQKLGFRLVFWLCVAVHVIAVAALAYVLLAQCADRSGGPRTVRRRASAALGRRVQYHGPDMTGWVLVGPEAVETDDQLMDWINRSTDFVRELPAK